MGQPPSYPLPMQIILRPQSLSWVPLLLSNFPLSPALKIPFLWTITCLCCISCIFQVSVLCLRCVCFFLLNLGPVSLVVCTFLCILITPLCRRQSRCGFNPWVRKILWKRNGQPISVFSPGKFHGQRSLVGYRISKNQTHLSD